MRPFRPLALLALLLPLAGCGGGGNENAPKDNPFGFKSLGAASIETRALALSQDGKTIVGTESYEPGTNPIGWLNGGGVTRLPLVAPGDNFTVASSVSGDGEVVVGYGTVAPELEEPILSTGNPTAVRWTADTGAEELPNLPSGLWSVAHSVSENASVIVGASVVPDAVAPAGWSTRAVIWTNGNIEDMGLPVGEPSAVATKVSADGKVVIGTFGTSKGFRWTRATGFQLLPPYGGATAFLPLALSRDGSIVVGTSGGKAVRWANGQTQVLGQLWNWSTCVATAISGDGTRIVGYAANSVTPDEGQVEAFIWDPINGLRSLKEAMVHIGMANAFRDWTSSMATAISTDGQTVVGYGMSPNGKFEAWAARIP
jgi:uncharacterized membrane protein